MRHTLAPEARVADALDFGGDRRPGLVAECAGHAALQAHVLPALQHGVPCVIASIGGLHDDALLDRLDRAATAGDTQLRLISGAIAAIDALAAARLGGLDTVTYVGRKPPRGWLGTPAEQACDLSALSQPCVFFRGTAREARGRSEERQRRGHRVAGGRGPGPHAGRAGRRPGVARNVHEVVAEGAFGRLRLSIENLPLAANPKTSALTVWSLARAVRDRVDRRIC